MEWIKGLCGVCPAGCWIEAAIDDGRLVDIRPDKSYSLGTICHLGKHSQEIIYSEHRLKYPLKRSGPKGTFDFERRRCTINLHAVTERND